MNKKIRGTKVNGSENFKLHTSLQTEKENKSLLEKLEGT